MKRILSYRIDRSRSGKTIQSYLKNLGYSRHIFTHLKRTSNGICINGIPAYTNHCLTENEILTVSIVEEAASENIVPVPMELSIIYEDDDILVVDKPADTPIHPSINNYDNTLANGIAYYYQKQEIPFVYRCINRLDRDTTGLLVIAKHMLSAAILSNMSENKRIHREYLAIASGNAPAKGTVHAPIARKTGSALERLVNFSDGEAAVTHFKRVAYKNGHSLISLKLETGRTHQIRVHLKYLGFPIIGDYLYHPDLRLIQRQALHSHRLEFTHPITGEAMSFLSPMPSDMQMIFPENPDPKSVVK